MKAGPWQTVDGYCAVRVREGGNVDKIEDRVAFIEKTPRVRIREWHFTPEHQDFLNWAQGPKGQGGGGDPEKEALYGFYQPSRDWCDAMLRLLGYELADAEEDPHR